MVQIILNACQAICCIALIISLLDGDALYWDWPSIAWLNIVTIIEFYVIIYGCPEAKQNRPVNLRPCRQNKFTQKKYHLQTVI